jgi:dTDP-4-dehydrorhamnose reductase
MVYIDNILVTGCNGQLGRSIQDAATEYSEYNFFFTDKEELDITDPEAVEAFVLEHEIDCIINCAAYTAVDKAESNEEICDLLNHYAPRYLAEAIQLRKGAMIQISTDYVFDGHAYTPYTEDMPTNPQSVYGRTKLAGEQAVQEVCENSVIIRTAWLYSRFGNNFVKTMLRLASERKELGVVYDQIGTPTNADDLAYAIMTIISEGIVPGIYHYTNEGCASWYDFAMTIFRFDSNDIYEHVKPLRTADYPTSAARPPYSVLDKSKIKETYGLTIPYWDDTLCDCMEIMRFEEKEAMEQAAKEKENK